MKYWKRNLVVWGEGGGGGGGGGGEEGGEGGSLVLAFTILAKVISNIGWFIMWVQAIEVRY
jgi:hypothetical protein